MSGAVPPPPPPGAAPGRSTYEPGSAGDVAAPATEQPVPGPPTVHAPVPMPPAEASATAAQPVAPPATAAQPVAPPPAVPPGPPVIPPGGQPAPVQRVSTATRMPPAISPASQFSQAVTPAPARPGQPVVHSVQVNVHNHGLPPQPGYDDATAGQYYPPAGYPPQQYGQPQYADAQYDPQYGEPQYADPQYAAQGAGYAPAPGATAPARRLTPGWIAFIALDVVLVIAALVFAINLMGGGDPAEAGTDPTPAATGSPAPGADDGASGAEQWAVPAGASVFAAPSGNITCYIADDEARCGIHELNNQPAPVETCEGTVGYVAVVDASGAISSPCIAADAQPQKATGDVRKLEYGQTTTANGFTCSSANTGMTCVADATGKGFTIAKAGVRTS